MGRIRDTRKAIKKVQDELYKRGAETSEEGETIVPEDKKKRKGKHEDSGAFLSGSNPVRNLTNEELIEEEKNLKEFAGKLLDPHYKKGGKIKIGVPVINAKKRSKRIG